MATAGESTPRRRKDAEDMTVRVDDPVKVVKTDGDTLLGIVREREEFVDFDAPARVVVEGKDDEINTSVERVEVATGTHADLVKSLVGGGDD